MLCDSRDQNDSHVRNFIIIHNAKEHIVCIKSLYVCDKVEFGQCVSE